METMIFRFDIHVASAATLLTAAAALALALVQASTARLRLAPAAQWRAARPRRR